MSVNSYDINIVKTAPMWFFWNNSCSNVDGWRSRIESGCEGRKADQFHGGGGGGWVGKKRRSVGG